MPILSQTQAARVRFIRTVLAWHGHGQADLAAVLGRTQQSASQKLGGRARFTDDELLRIADAYGLDPGLLLRPPALEPVLGDPAVRSRDEALVPSWFWQVGRSEGTFFGPGVASDNKGFLRVAA